MGFRFKKIFLNILVMSSFAYTSAYATIWHVDLTASPNGDGLNWSSAFQSLQIALNNAWSGDEIRIAQGIYRPTNQQGDRNISFQLKNGVRVRGGYAGRQSSYPNRRNILVYKTILSGDLNGNDVPPFQNANDNSFHVVYAAHLSDSSTLLEGVTVTGGNANSSECCFNQRGGGIYVVNSTITFRNILVFQNSAFGIAAGQGGGMYIVTDGDVLIEKSRILENRSEVKGGGVFVRESDPRFEDVEFIANSSTSGGGLHSFMSPVNLLRTRFENNDASYSGSAAYIEAGPGGLIRDSSFVNNRSDQYSGCLRTSASVLEVERSLFKTNTFAGIENRGTYSDSHLSVKHSAFISNGGAGIVNQKPLISGSTSSEIVNSVFLRNDSGILNIAGTYTEVGNSTFSFNLNSGIRNVYSEDITVGANNIFWENGLNDSFSNLSGEGPYEMDYSLIGGSARYGNFGDGNIDKDPLFQRDGVHLNPSSPCVDAGDPNFDPKGNLHDIDRQSRILGNRIDMGADETR